MLGGEFQIVPGGKGANQAVAAARAGARVTFVANIGRDDFGDAAFDDCETKASIRAISRAANLRRAGWHSFWLIAAARI